MAKVKPEHVPVLLKGGPCDGKRTTAIRTVDLLDSVKCGGVWYDPTDRTTKDNRVIYTTRSSQQPPQPPPTPDVAKPMKAHHAWHGMLRHVFVEAPNELVHSAEARKAMRGLRSRRGLR